LQKNFFDIYKNLMGLERNLLRLKLEIILS